MRPSRAIAAALAAVAILAPAAQAARWAGPGWAPAGYARRHHHRPWTDPLPLMLKDAEAYWGGRPPCGAPSFDRVTAIPSDAGAQADSWAFVSPLDLAACRISLVAGDWGTWRQEAENWETLCPLVVHELGHLFGLPDGTGIMAHVQAAPYLPACQRPASLWVGELVTITAAGETATS